MKCTKLIYLSPVFGSVMCEDLPNEDNRYVDFGPEAAMALYEREPEVVQWASEHIEDLTFAVPEELESLIVKAVFGQLYAEDYDLQLITEIYVRQEPTEEQHKQIIDWISGQMSDGWGEGVEQKPVYSESVSYEECEFDEDSCEYDTKTRYAEAEYFLHPWANDASWIVKLVKEEPAELDIEEPDIKEELRTTLLKVKELIDEIVEELKNVT